MILSFLGMTLLATMVSIWITSSANITFGAAALELLDGTQRQWLRAALLSNNFFSFAVTALLASFIIYRKRWLEAVGLDRFPSVSPALGSTLLFLVSLPVVLYIAWLNLQIPLPNWAVADEEQTNLLIGTILKIESTPELLMALLTMAITPALGEELLMRGVLQRRILGGLINNHHWYIWLAAAVFSAGHFEFAGFLPRLVLGAALGYAYHWTKSLWVPILLHFLYNGIQVLYIYSSGEFTPDTELDFVPAWWVGLGGLLLAAVALWYGEQRFGGPAADLEGAADVVAERSRSTGAREKF
jgi:membrane protease YdiL (CAAX protease family)